jgi:hypothetical protein
LKISISSIQKPDKIRKGIENLSHMNHLGTPSIVVSIHHPQITLKIDDKLDHRTRLNKLRKNETIQSMFSDHRRIKLDILRKYTLSLGLDSPSTKVVNISSSELLGSQTRFIIACAGLVLGLWHCLGSGVQGN